MTPSDQQAERLLPCNQKPDAKFYKCFTPGHPFIETLGESHDETCPAHYRPAVSAALAELRAENLSKEPWAANVRLNEKVAKQDADIERLTSLLPEAEARGRIAGLEQARAAVAMHKEVSSGLLPETSDRVEYAICLGRIHTCDLITDQISALTKEPSP